MQLNPIVEVQVHGGSLFTVLYISLTCRFQKENYWVMYLWIFLNSFFYYIIDFLVGPYILCGFFPTIIHRNKRLLFFMSPYTFDQFASDFGFFSWEKLQFFDTINFDLQGHVQIIRLPSNIGMECIFKIVNDICVANLSWNSSIPT